MQSQKDFKNELSSKLQPIRDFIEDEGGFKECAFTLASMIEFNSILLMVAHKVESIPYNLHQIVSGNLSDETFDLKSLSKIFLDESNFSENIENLFMEVISPFQLSLSLLEFSYDINNLMIFISDKPQSSVILGHLMHPIHYNGISLVYKLHRLFSTIDLSYIDELRKLRALKYNSEMH